MFRAFHVYRVVMGCLLKYILIITAENPVRNPSNRLTFAMFHTTICSVEHSFLQEPLPVPERNLIIMKLNAAAIYHDLKEYYDIEYYRKAEQQTELGRPRYYKGTPLRDSYLLLALDTEDVLPAGTYICSRVPSLSDPVHTTVLLLKEEADASELYNRLQEIYDFYDEWASTCIQNVEDFQDFRSLISTTYRMMQTPLCLMDNQFTVVAQAQAQDPLSSFMLFGENSQLSIDTVNDLISNPHLRYLDSSHGELDFEYDKNYKLYNFFYHDHYSGRLIMPVADTEDPQRISLILNQLAEAVEYLLRRFGSFHSTSNTQNLLRSFFTESLAGRVPQTQSLLQIQKNTGWEDGHSYMIVSFLPEHRLKKDLYPPYLISQVEELWTDSCAVEKDGNVAMLINLSVNGEKNLADFYQSLAYMVRDGLMIAGCSRVFRKLADAGLFYRQSLFAIEFGQQKDSTRWYFRFNDYALDYILSCGTGLFKPEQVCHPALLLLREHDQTRQTSYFSTLYAYFECQFNMSHAAKKLFIHRSTFISRMERIEELTGLNLNDYSTRLYLEVSFHILQKADSPSIAQFYV